MVKLRFFRKMRPTLHLLRGGGVSPTRHRTSGETTSGTQGQAQVVSAGVGGPEKQQNRLRRYQDDELLSGDIFLSQNGHPFFPRRDPRKPWKNSFSSKTRIFMFFSWFLLVFCHFEEKYLKMAGKVVWAGGRDLKSPI